MRQIEPVDADTAQMTGAEAAQIVANILKTLHDMICDTKRIPKAEFGRYAKFASQGLMDADAEIRFLFRDEISQAIKRKRARPLLIAIYKMIKYGGIDSPLAGKLLELDDTRADGGSKIPRDRFIERWNSIEAQVPNIERANQVRRLSNDAASIKAILNRARSMKRAGVRLRWYNERAVSKQK